MAISQSYLNERTSHSQRVATFRSSARDLHARSHSDRGARLVPGPAAPLAQARIVLVDSNFAKLDWRSGSLDSGSVGALALAVTRTRTMVGVVGQVKLPTRAAETDLVEAAS